MCGVNPCYGQLTAPIEHIVDTTKMVLSGAQKVAVANGINALKVKVAYGDSLIKVLQGSVWLLNQVYIKSEQQLQDKRKQVEGLEKQIASYDKMLDEYKNPPFFKAYKGELGVLLGIVIGIGIVKLLK